MCAWSTVAIQVKSTRKCLSKPNQKNGQAMWYNCCGYPTNFLFIFVLLEDGPPIFWLRRASDIPTTKSGKFSITLNSKSDFGRVRPGALHHQLSSAYVEQKRNATLEEALNMIVPTHNNGVLENNGISEFDLRVVGPSGGYLVMPDVQNTAVDRIWWTSHGSPLRVQFKVATPVRGRSGLMVRTAKHGGRCDGLTTGKPYDVGDFDILIVLCLDRTSYKLIGYWKISEEQLIANGIVTNQSKKGVQSIVVHSDATDRMTSARVCDHGRWNRISRAWWVDCV